MNSIVSERTISILILSRGGEALKFSLDSLGLGRSNLEALVWIDEDYPELNK